MRFISCTVELVADRAERDPKVFTRIDMRFTVRGRASTATQSTCGSAFARKILFGHGDARKTALITHSVRILDAV